MFKTLHINELERGFIYEGQDLIKYLKAGKYRLWMKKDMTCELMSVTEPFELSEAKLKYLLKNDAFRSEVDVLDVPDGHMTLRYKDGKADALYGTGFNAFWKVDCENTFKDFDMSQPEIKEDLPILMRYAASRPDLIYMRVVESYEKGILFIDNQVERLLEPGRYLFWNKEGRVNIQTVDMRVKALEIQGQEILTSDKVPLRVNFVCQYKIVDPLRSLTDFKRHEEQVYSCLQLLLRELIGTMNFDELMAQKHLLGQTLLEKAKQLADEYAVAFHSGGIKDIILPGDIRDIMNTVLLAEKRAAANVITRREETASTRSLLNTAKLLDENKTLYKLKELEYIERICDKIGNVSLSGGQGLLEQLQTALLVK